MSMILVLGVAVLLTLVGVIVAAVIILSKNSKK